MAFLVLLERLSPEQRAVLLLRDVFDYGYGEIAGIVGKSEANVRQLAVAGPAPRRRAAPALRGLARAARGARAALLRGDAGRRPRRARGAARPRRRAPRRRRRQGPRAGEGAPRPQPGGAHAGGVGACGPARPGAPDPACRGQRPARRAGLGRLGRRARRDGARHRGRARSGRCGSVVNPDKLGHLGQVGDMRALLGTAEDGGTFLAGPGARIRHPVRRPMSAPPALRRTLACSAGARPSPTPAMSARRTCPTATCWPRGSPRRSTAAG